MSLYDEIVLYEGLPMSLARKYTKQGKENAENMSPELKRIHSDIFGDKQRIVIGRFETKDYLSTLSDKLNDILSDITNNAITAEDGSDNILDSIRIISNQRDPSTVFVLNNNNRGNLSPDVDKIIRRAVIPSDSKIDKYSLKTLFKILKKYIIKDKVNDLQNRLSSYFTDVSKGSSSTEIVLSRHPYDVGGMSTKQSWKSCKEATCGQFREHLDDEVGEILIAYIVNPNRKGKDILNDAIARLLVLPVYEYEGGDLGMWVARDVYPKSFPQNDKDQFHDIVFKFMSKFTFPIFQGDNDHDIVMYNNYYPDTSYAGRSKDDPAARQTQEGRDAIVQQFNDDVDSLISSLPLRRKDNLLFMADRLGEIVDSEISDDWELDVNDYKPNEKIITTMDNIFSALYTVAGGNMPGIAEPDIQDLYIDSLEDDELISVLEDATSGDVNRIVSNIVISDWAENGIGNVYDFNALEIYDILVDDYLQTLMNSYGYHLTDDDTLSYYIDFAVMDLWWLKKFGFDFSQWDASELALDDVYDSLNIDGDIERFTDLYTTFMLPDSVDTNHDFGFDSIPDWDDHEDEVKSRFNSIISDNKESFAMSELEHNIKDAELVLSRIPDIESAFRYSATGDSTTLGKSGFVMHNDDAKTFANRVATNLIIWYSRVVPELDMSVDEVLATIEKLADEKIRDDGEFDMNMVSDRIKNIHSKNSEVRKEHPQQTIKFEQNKTFF